MPEKLSPAVERSLAIIGAFLGVAVPLITLVIYFARIDPKFDAINAELAAAKAEQSLINATTTKILADLATRTKTIEDGRPANLQRLAKVEADDAAVDSRLGRIETKIDRILFDRKP